MNLLAVLLCGIWAMFSGFVWYSPVLFAKPWIKLGGLSEKDLKMNQSEMTKRYGTTFLLNLFSALLLSMFFLSRGNTLGMNIMLVTLWWLIFTLIPTFVTNFYNRKPLKLTLINTGYQLVSFLGFAFILSFLG